MASTSIHISEVLSSRTGRIWLEPGGESARGCQGLVCAVSPGRAGETQGAGAVPGLRPLFQTIPLHRVNSVLFSSSLGEL